MESKFTGGLLGLIGISILQYLICAFTLGIGAPWAICMKEKWIAFRDKIGKVAYPFIFFFSLILLDFSFRALQSA